MTSPSPPRPQGHDTNPAEVFSEAEKLASMRHPCVMGFYGIVTSPEAYATVTEYICHGSLRGGLLKVKKKVLGRGTGGGGGSVAGCRRRQPPVPRPPYSTAADWPPVPQVSPGPNLCGRCPTPSCAHPILALRPVQGINDKRLRAYIALQAAHGMEYLHLNYMVHFDLKVGPLAI